MTLFSKLSALVFIPVVAFILGFARPDLMEGRPLNRSAMKRMFNTKPVGASPIKAFGDSYTQILDGYYKNIDPTELKYSAMTGLVSSLGDPHTMFFDPQFAEVFSKETTGNKDFVGVGARLMQHDLGAKIGFIFEEGPAFKAGLRENDIIVAVNGETMAGKRVDYLVSKIRGPEGTKVNISVLQRGSKTPQVFTCIRRRVMQPTVDGKVLEGTDIGYIAVYSFAQVTAGEFSRMLDRLNAETLRGLVIDLRSNGGGLLEAARDMLSNFVEEKRVVTMRRRDGTEETTDTRAGLKREITCPIVILTNEDTASASEIFAGTLRQYGKAVLLGTHSYGKASVQNVFPISRKEGSEVKITIAKYFLPDGADISRKQDEDGVYISGGLKPDFEVPMSLDPRLTPGDPELDNQLIRAIEYIKEKRP